MTIKVHFSEEDWQRISRDWNAWWAGELERPLVTLEVNTARDIDGSQFTKFGLDTPVDDIIDNWQRVFEGAYFFGDAYPKWWVNYGPGAAAAWLGSPVSWTPDTTWFWPLKGVKDLSEIHPVYDPANPWWLRTLEVSRRAVERWGSQVLVGTSDIGGNLDILASLRGADKLLIDLIEQPEQVERLMGEITALWNRYYDELYAITSSPGRGNACWGPLWSPGKGYMLQCDFSYMISPVMFKRYVQPDLAACCNHLEYGFYHLDGKGEIPHLDHLLAIERLRGIQWQPGDGQPMAEGWPDLLKRMRQGNKLVQVFVTCQGALSLKRELGGRGFIYHIVNENLTVEQAQAFIHTLKQA